MFSIRESNVTIIVRDMDRSIRFYEALGLTLKHRWGDNYAMMEAPGVTIGLHPGREGDTIHPNTSIGFIIDDMEKAKLILEKENIQYQLHDDAKSGIIANFTDPDGTALYLMVPKWSYA